MSRWYCGDCSKTATEERVNPCPACCGFTSLDDDLRGQIGELAIALNRSPIFDIGRALSPELAAAIRIIEDVAAGDAS